MDWPADEPVPRPFKGATVLLKDHEYDDGRPAIVTEVHDGGSIDAQSIQTSFVMSELSVFSAWGEAGSEKPYWPQWEWPPEQLALFRKLYDREPPRAKLVKRNIRL